MGNVKGLATTMVKCVCCLAVAALPFHPALAQQDQEAELAKKLSNPVAAMISVPVQYNHDDYGGRSDGASVDTLVLQPVIPFSLNDDWNLITRTLIPFADAHAFPLAALDSSGLADITASQFFSPKSPTTVPAAGACESSSPSFFQSRADVDMAFSPAVTGTPVFKEKA